jgi:hypothetical protein
VLPFLGIDVGASAIGVEDCDSRDVIERYFQVEEKSDVLVGRRVEEG